MTAPAAICLAGLTVAGWLDTRASATALAVAVGIALGVAPLWHRGGERAASGADDQARHVLALSADLRAAREEADRLLDVLPEPVVILGTDRILMHANPAAAAMLGLNLAPLLRHPALMAAVNAAWSNRGATEARLRLSVPVPSDLRASVIPLDSPGGMGGRTLILFSDRSAEQAVARMRADFVANASHELRTPLTALVGFIDTLRGPAADDPVAQARFLGIMSEQAARMTRLIDDLLSLSRLEVMEHQLPTEVVVVAALLERVVVEFEARLAGRGMRLSKDVQADLPAVVGDAHQLAQLFQNLLDNAVKYGRDSGTIRLGVHAAAPDGNWPARPGLVMTVADDGIGIARAHLPRLTERFYRVDAGRSRVIGGTGLGLAIVKHVVNRHRGEMRIESEEGEGTSVSVWLPASEGTVTKIS
ncbi:MAG: PAS domain-containing protein [Acetobacteraceae bacterium]|nr:PAS domain-containing protein [Acetobacteraceae bacterium]